ncbi:MAG: hypothetical protein JWM34_2116 [Ilumatobacteraceae bacterium]|nr:hypothetical protein [Ilumatobacteraceae bacterium]
MVGPISLQGNCVGFAIGDGFTVIIWPEGTRWITATNEVEMEDGTPVALGDDVRLGGGLEQVQFLDRYPIGGAAMDASVLTCDRVEPDDKRLVCRPLNRHGPAT